MEIFRSIVMKLLADYKVKYAGNSPHITKDFEVESYKRKLRVLDKTTPEEWLEMEIEFYLFVIKCYREYSESVTWNQSIPSWGGTWTSTNPTLINQGTSISTPIYPISSSSPSTSFFTSKPKQPAHKFKRQKKC